jgi:opacity protein-like surface antigen
MKLCGKGFQKGQRLWMLSAVVLGFILAPGSVWAGGNLLAEDLSKGVFSIGGRAVYYDPIDGNDDWRGGAQFRWYLGEAFALEASMDYRRNDFGDSTVRTFPLQLSGLFYLLPGKRLSPYLIGGGGWYYTDVDGPGNFEDVQQRFGLHGGGGVQLMLSRNWSVDGSYRFVWLERIRSIDANANNTKFQDEGHMVTIGLNYHF